MSWGHSVSWLGTLRPEIIHVAPQEINRCIYLAPSTPNKSHTKTPSQIERCLLPARWGARRISPAPPADGTPRATVPAAFGEKRQLYPVLRLPTATPSPLPPAFVQHARPAASSEQPLCGIVEILLGRVVARGRERWAKETRDEEHFCCAGWRTHEVWARTRWMGGGVRGFVSVGGTQSSNLNSGRATRVAFRCCNNNRGEPLPGAGCGH